MNSGDLFLLVGGLLLVIALALFVPIKHSGSKANPPAEHHLTGPIFRNDDRYWRGFLYYNPDDPDALVPKRYGIGWTINFGHPLGKLFALAILALILLPIVLTLLFPGFAQTYGCHTLGC